MRTHTGVANSDHDEVFQLLPWYVNGTLGGSQKTLVEEHLRSCIMCRRALPGEYRTLDMFRNESPLDQSVQAGFERLHNRIAARTPPTQSAPQPTGAASMSWGSIVSFIRTFAGARVRPALVTAVLAGLAIGLVVTRVEIEEHPGDGFGYSGTATATAGYHTLSSPVVGAADPDDVHVIFAPGTNIETIEVLLKALPARIVAGPDSNGAYTVRLVNMPGEDKRQAAIVGLRGQPQVVFAEAAQPLSVSAERGAQSE